MPPLPPVYNTLDVSLQFTDGDALTASSHVFLNYTGGPPAAADCITFGNDVATSFDGSINLALSDQVALVGVIVTDLSMPSGARGEAVVNLPGHNASPLLTNGACFNIAAKINRRYRGGKPKVFIPGVMASQVANGVTLDPVSQSGMTTSWNDFIAELGGKVLPTFTTGASVNISYYSGFTAVQNPLTKRWRNVPTLRGVPLVDPIDTWVCQSVLGSQRRRLRG